MKGGREVGRGGKGHERRCGSYETHRQMTRLS